MLESKYQAKLIARLEHKFPGCVVIKNDPGYMQGVPDLLFLYGPFWAMLEVKASANAPEQPNQHYYVQLFGSMSFSAFIHPDNEEEVLDALQQAFESIWHTRVS